MTIPVQSLPPDPSDIEARVTTVQALTIGRTTIVRCVTEDNLEVCGAFTGRLSDSATFRVRAARTNARHRLERVREARARRNLMD